MEKIDYSNLDLATRIDYGVKKGVANALLEHKRNGKSIYIMKDDQIIEIPPEQIKISEVPYPETNINR